MIQFVGSCEEDRRNFKITEKKEFWFRNFSNIIAILVTNDTRNRYFTGHLIIEHRFFLQALLLYHQDKREN